MASTQIHRTAKGLVDLGAARSLEEAERMLRGFVLQVDVGPDIDSSATQAALLTLANTAPRAFLGGVRVRLAQDAPVIGGWGRDTMLSEALEGYGVSLVDEHTPTNITVALAGARPAQAGPVVYPTWSSWCGGVVDNADRVLDDKSTCELAPALAAALAVSEAFQHLTGAPLAARRDVGVSLWRPDLHWRHPDGRGPHLTHLPSSYWLLGLGHLGQAFAWVIGLLGTTASDPIAVLLQDYDVVESVNWSTSLLTKRQHAGRRKTRVVAAALEQAGFATSITERAYDEQTQRARTEPLLALAGFDHPAPRRLLEDSGFELVVDAGLGAGARSYLDMTLHCFPGPIAAKDAFPAQPPALKTLPKAYESMLQARVANGEDEGTARCGLIDVAGTSVAASFVGVVAACLAVSEPLRQLHEGNSYDVIDLSLRSPQFLEAVGSEIQQAPTFGAVARGM